MCVFVGMGKGERRRRRKGALVKRDLCAHVHVCMAPPLMERSYRSIPNGTYRVILRIGKAGCHPVAIAQVVEH